MKVKIKVKSLILISIITMIILVWGIPFASLQIANYLNDKNNDKAEFFYQRYYQYPLVSNTIKGKYIYAESLIDGFSKFQITFSGWGGGSNTDPIKLEEAKKLLGGIVREENISKSKVEYMEKAYKRLLDIGISTNDVGMLKKWLDFKNPQETEKMAYTRDMYRAFLFHVNREEERALEIAEKYFQSDLRDSLLDVLLSEIYFFQGDYEKTGDFLEEANKMNYWDRMEPIFASYRYLDRKYFLEYEKDILGNTNKIKGTVFFEDKPLPFVEIYVQEPHGGFRTGGGNYLGITDENGYFETVPIREGTVQLVLGLDGVALTDKVLQKTSVDYIELKGQDVNVDFVFRETLNILSPRPRTLVKKDIIEVSWEPVSGAYYYNVEPVIFSDPYNLKGNSSRGPIGDIKGHIKITGTRASFNIENLKENMVGLSFSGEEMLLAPSGVLGVFLPGIEYPIVVNAYDKEGNIITSSLPLRAYYDKIPSIIKDGDLSEGQKIILSKDYPKAIAYYKKVLEDKPSDKEALLYLSKIFAIGWKDGEKDYEKAISYAKRYEDSVSREDMLFKVIAYMDFKDIGDNKDLIKDVLNNIKTYDDEYYYTLAQLNIVNKEYKKARDAYDRIGDYIPVDLVYLNLYLKDYNKAVENVKSDKFYYSLLSTSKTTDAILNLEINGLGEEDKKVFDDFLIKLLDREAYKQKDELYKKATSKIENKSAITIINQIYKDNGWLDRY